MCCLSIFEGEGLKPGQVFSSTFIGITFERNEILSWCKFHNKEEIKGFNLIYSLKKNILTFDTLNRGRTVFFNRGNDDNLYQNICFDHV